MRRLMFAAVALAFASTLFAGGHACAAGQARVFSDGDISFANGLSTEKFDALRARYGKTFLYMERGDKTYLITDADTLDRVRHIVQPQRQLGQEQAKLGTHQAALGTQQASLGLEQSRIGMQQMGASEAEQRRLSAKQEELSRKQDALSRQQEELSKQQEALSAKQESLQKDSDTRIDTVLDQAIASGLASQVK